MTELSTECNTKLRVAGLIEESIVDGPGFRFTIFTQGCPHNCEGCHNPQTHDFKAGKLMEIDDIFDKIKQNPILSGATFSGGEPFCQPKELFLLGQKIKSIGQNIFCYTGFTYEELIELGQKNSSVLDLLGIVDVLVDGKFEKDKKDLTLLYKGSSNQRVIKLNKGKIEKIYNNDVTEISI